jgi:hypothetical protein
MTIFLIFKEESRSKQSLRVFTKKNQGLEEKCAYHMILRDVQVEIKVWKENLGLQSMSFLNEKNA